MAEQENNSQLEAYVNYSKNPPGKTIIEKLYDEICQYAGPCCFWHGDMSELVWSEKKCFGKFARWQFMCYMRANKVPVTLAVKWAEKRKLIFLDEHMGSWLELIDKFTEPVDDDLKSYYCWNGLAREAYWVHDISPCKPWIDSHYSTPYGKILTCSEEPKKKRKRRN